MKAHEIFFVVVVDPKVQRESRRKKNHDKNNGLGNADQLPFNKSYSLLPCFFYFTWEWQCSMCQAMKHICSMSLAGNQHMSEHMTHSWRLIMRSGCRSSRHGFLFQAKQINNPFHLSVSVTKTKKWCLEVLQFSYNQNE